MAHFNFVISQNAKWWHAGFYIDRHRMTSSKYAYRKVLFYKKSTGNISTTCNLWRSECTGIHFRAGLPPRPAWQLTTLPQTP